MNMNRFRTDLQYIFLNMFVNRIPSWFVRRFIYSLCGMKIGKEARIGIGTVIYHPSGISIGNRSIINEFCYLDGRGGIMIDHDVSISIYSKVITGTHVMNDNEFRYRSGKIKIRHHVWIGTGATILNDSLIAQYTVIGAGCVFKGTSSPGDVVVGNPGRAIRKRKDSLDYKIDYTPFFR